MKYLLEIHHGIGDVVQFTGLLESIRKYDNNAYIAVIVNKDAYKTLFLNDNRIQKFYKIDLVDMSKVELIKTVIAMRNEHFDYLFISPISNKRAVSVLALLISAKHSYGEQLKKLSQVSSRYIAVQKKKVHIVKRNDNVLLSAKIPFECCRPKLYCNSELPVDIPEKSIAICIGTSIPQKTWFIERYMKVAEYFSRKGYQIVLLGGVKEERDYKQSGFMNSNWIDLMGKVDLAGTATACKKCKLVIGGDTGVMHIAAAMGVTTLTIFSCTDPKFHCPYSENSYFYCVKLNCQYCYGQEEMHNCKEYKCINNIQTKDIISLAEKILKQDNLENIQNYYFEIEKELDFII